MGTTFVGIREHGFWMRDGVLELWLRLLALYIEEPTEQSATAGQLRDRWLLASRGFFTGCVPDGLEESVATEEGEKLVRAAIHSLLEALKQAPSHLNRDVLNLLGHENSTFVDDFETWRLIEVGRALLDLIDGKITAGPTNTTFMPGSRSSPTSPNV